MKIIKNILKIAGVLILLGVLYLGCSFYKVSIWYSDYKAPLIKIDDELKPYRTLHKVRDHLLKIHPDNVLYQDAQKVLARMPVYEELLSRYLNETLQNKNIDFIGNVHPYVEGNTEYTIRHYQKTMLLLGQKPYDAVGAEGFDSEYLNSHSLWQELARGSLRLNKAAPVQADVDILIRESAPVAHAIQNKILATGCEDYYIHGLQMDVFEKELAGTGYEYLCRELIFLRTEIALALLNRFMIKHNLQSGVLVQGDSHRYQFKVLKEKFKIPGEIMSTVPKTEQSTSYFQ